MKSVGIVGLGYVGLPLAVQVAAKGYTVYGVDLNQALIDKVNRRESPYVNDDRFKRAITQIPAAALSASSSYDRLSTADVIVICVPTPTTDNNPDLSYVLQASQSVAEKMHKGQLIVLESTVNPGVTREEVLPILTLIGWIGTSLVALQAGKLIGKKSDVAKQYARYVNDEWTEYITNAYDLIRNHLAYKLPASDEEKKAVRELCEKLPAYEMHYIREYEKYRQ